MALLAENIPLSDEDVAVAVQSGHTEQFGVLVERYEQKMKRYARRFLFGYDDAEDLVQDVFIKAFVNIRSFNVKRRFSPWLYRIAHNEFITAIKRKKREPLPFFDPDVLFPHPVSRETADRDLLDRELKEMVEACLDRIDAKYREPIVLYFFEELSYEEIADVLGIPISTVGVRLKRGKEQLRKKYALLNEAIPVTF